MTRHSLALLCAIVCASFFAACGGEEEDRISGSWTAGRVDLVLARKEQGYEGQLIIGGKAHDIKAELKEERYEGKFRSGNSEFPFHFQLAGDVLQLESSGTRHDLKRKVVEPDRNPLAEVGNPLLEVEPSTPATTPITTPGG